MNRLLSFLCALGTFALTIPMPLGAAEVPTKDSIICALDPACANRQPAAEPPTRSLGRGVTVQKTTTEQPLAINLYINFAYNSAELTSDARITLDQLGGALSDPRLRSFSFLIGGHTDARGGAEYNLKLSERRSEAVRNYMITQFGITPERLVAKGFGKLQLLDPSRPEDGVNRRVQIVNTGVEGARK